MRKFRRHNPSILEKKAAGNPITAKENILKAAVALKASDDDLNGLKHGLVEALVRISKDERPEKILGLIKPPHRPKDRFILKRDRIIALQYWDRTNRTGIKQEPIAKSIGKFWGLGERRVRQIAEPLNDWAMKEIGRRGGLVKFTSTECELIKYLKRILKTKKEGN